MGKCHPEKTNVDRGEAEIYIGFRDLIRDGFDAKMHWFARGDNVLMFTSRAANVYYIILNVN